jgi:hypothetical protein
VQIELIDDPELVARLGESSTERTRGVLHLSEIYKSLMVRLQPKRFGGNKPFDTRKVETGLIFENVLEQGLREKFATQRVGEIVSDEGVWMTPDGVNPTEACGEEYKCTWMSSRLHEGTTPYTDEYGMPTPKFLHWFFQMKGYAKWLQTDTFLLRVLHINGDYERLPGIGYQPTFMTHRIRFSEQEIEDNWTMLMNHARDEKMMA